MTTPSPPTLSLQSTLPRLPVPSLKETCSLYLHSLLPLQTPEEREKTKAIVQDFMTGTLGSSLQERLVDIDRASPTNWLEDNFWLRKAYLEWREPLMVNSNWYMLGKNDDHHPKELLANNGQCLPADRYSHFQIRRAANMIFYALNYNEILEKQELPVEMVRGKQPQCMWQYSRIFGVTRVPLHHCDTLVQEDPATLLHIIVLAHDQIYKLQVYSLVNGKKERLSIDAIERELLIITSHSLHTKNRQKPISLLTSWDRDNWTVARNHLLTLDPVGNRNALSTIESGLFAVCLDDYSHGADTGSWSKTAFCGQQNLGQGHNRWFDKSMSLVVENNGKSFLMGEHSPVDALTVSYVWDHMLRTSVASAITSMTSKEPSWMTSQPAPVVDHVDSSSPSSLVEHLTWATDAQLDTYLHQAQLSANQTSARSDSYVLHFEEYGTDWVKRVGKVPPDAFFQMVLQLAYYRVHHKVTATYETASTRKYLRGRTETIRTCSIDSKKFVEAFDTPSVSDQEKYDLLAKATAAHKKYTQIASDGHGCDRHLLVLKLLNMDHQVFDKKSGTIAVAPMHDIFKDPIFAESQTWRLSTSGLQAGDQLMGTGFGAAYKHGYGINYMAARNLVKFGIETKVDEDSVSAKAFADAITKTMQDLRDLCERTNNSHATSPSSSSSYNNAARL